MILAGYTRPDGLICTTPERELKAIAAFNFTAADLGLDIKISSLSDTVCSNEKTDVALVYGTGMLLALGDGDAEINRILSEMYAAKRMAVRNHITAVRDTLPKAGDEV